MICPRDCLTVLWWDWTRTFCTCASLREWILKTLSPSTPCTMLLCYWNILILAGKDITLLWVCKKHWIWKWGIYDKFIKHQCWTKIKRANKYIGFHEEGFFSVDIQALFDRWCIWGLCTQLTVNMFKYCSDVTLAIKLLCTLPGLAHLILNKTWWIHWRILTGIQKRVRMSLWIVSLTWILGTGRRCLKTSPSLSHRCPQLHNRQALCLRIWQTLP